MGGGASRSKILQEGVDTMRLMFTFWGDGSASTEAKQASNKIPWHRVYEKKIGGPPLLGLRGVQFWKKESKQCG